VPFPGQADHIWNAALSYDKGGFSGRVSLNFNDSFITSISDNENFDIYTDQRYQLDVNVSQKINKKLTLFVEFVNLTNDPRVDYRFRRNFPTNFESYGWSARFGLNFKL